MLGKVTSGIRSTGSRTSEIAPSSTMTLHSMYMVIGRSMAVRGMLIRSVSADST